MYKYNFVLNEYNSSKEKKDILLSKLNKNWELSDKPEYIFVVGGDGTFLKALHKYQNIIDKVVFVPFTEGGIGFYTNHNNVCYKDDIIYAIEKKQLFLYEYELLEIRNGVNNFLALNEAKIINNEKPIYLDILVNDQYLEKYRGTGLCFSTSSGSTGFNKSCGGSIIYSLKNKLFQMCELYPVSTNKFRTINSPIIFNEKHKITIKLEENNGTLAIDTKTYPLVEKEIKISLSTKKVKVFSINNNQKRINSLKDIFIKN